MRRLLERSAARGQGRHADRGRRGGVRDATSPSRSPSPPPVTTIAWRLAHIIVGVPRRTRATATSAARTSTTGPSPTPAPPREALQQLDGGYAAVERRRARASDEEALARAVRAGRQVLSPSARCPTLVLHINREMIHHGAEIALLRDLYRAR